MAPSEVRFRIVTDHFDLNLTRALAISDAGRFNLAR